MSTGKWRKPTGFIYSTRYQERKAKRTSPQDTMLADFLKANSPSEKRQVIKNFAPHYFIFGDKLDPRNPYEERSDEL